MCHVVYAFYESDTRVRMYTEALADRGDHVDVVALSKEGQSPYEVIKGVHVHRIQHRVVNESSKGTYLYRLLKFFVKSTAFLARKTHNGSGPYDLIHVHSVPDFEVFAALIPKLFGAKVILDIHDIVPEFYAGKFNVGRESAVFKALALAEKASAKFSDHVIIANHLWETTLTSRSVCKRKCTTFLNYPAPIFFEAKRKTGNDGRFIMLYPGTLNRHQGVDLAVRAFARIKEEVPEAELHIYGDGPEKENLRELITRLRLDERVRLGDFMPVEQIVPIMADADLGIVPKRADSFGNEAFSTKIFEFMALGVPVVASNTKIDRHYFDDSMVKFFESGDERSLAAAMLALIRDQQLRASQAKNATAFIQANSWAHKKDEYLRLADKLTIRD